MAHVAEKKLFSCFRGAVTQIRHGRAMCLAIAHDRYDGEEDILR